ncbi:hypothetical protein ACIP2X_37955 [Streptomyces sp. NPDC089424]|uniref:hypothetical protein n=1 Tax=Streptomyces sp. NPDC089424 TaxID=3365917 RepID=UPI0037F84521
MNASAFRQEHGDPTTWTTADFESFEHLAETDHLADFTLVMDLGTAPFPIPTATLT